MTRAGLGSIVTLANPAAGASWSTTVPVGQRWRMWGGSCDITTSATAGNRNPFLTYKNGNTYLWAGGQSNLALGSQPTYFIPPSATYKIVIYEMVVELDDDYLYSTNYLPIPSKAIWLPAGTVVALTVQNLAVGDQISNVGLLVETAAA